MFGKEVKFKGVPPVIERAHLKVPYYRPGTEADTWKMSFSFCRGGIGDYVSWLSCVDWVLNTQLQLKVDLYCQYFFIDIPRHYFKDKFKGRLKILDMRELAGKNDLEIGPIFIPWEHAPNAIGMHLTDLGFCYFANSSPKEGYTDHIRLNVSDIRHPFKLPKRYGIICTGFTAPAREWRSGGVNGVSDYLNSIGITPVFMGKAQIFDSVINGKDFNYSSKNAEGIDFSKGIDIREKTSILETVRVIKDAALIVGLDNGLLHLAATQETPIVAGMTVASPEDREFRRPKGKVVYVTPTKEELPCIHCQTNQRFNNGQDFKYCFYKDYKCLEALADPKPWINAIDTVLRTDIL